MMDVTHLVAVSTLWGLDVDVFTLPLTQLITSAKAVFTDV